VILVDSSVWIDWLRARATTATRELDRAIDDERILLTPVILQELLQGAREPRHLTELRAYFEPLPMLFASARTHADAGALYARCRWVGITPRSPHDCLIAQTAIEHGVSLLADDRDFEQIAGVEPALRLLRR
jgi:predicted nucleic acid-binding protein